MQESENSRLLPDERLRSKDVYERFSRGQKRFIVAIISLVLVIARFGAGCFVPSIAVVAKDLKSTSTIITSTVAAYSFALSIGMLIWAPYAGFYGRRPIYLTALPLLFFGSLGVSVSRNVVELMAGRITQAFGASAVMNIGGATISDIYRLEERGTAMGIFSGAGLLGPVLAPLIGGFLATYASWRLTQLMISALALAVYILVFLFLPETSHPGPRGVDKVRAEVMLRERCSRTWVWLNPFAAFALLRGPNILFVAIAISLSSATDIGVLATTSLTNLTLIYHPCAGEGHRYGVASPVLIGACLLPSGIGCMLGAPFAGRLSDRAVINGTIRRGKWFPEDRLIATLPGGLFLAPLSVLVLGLAIEFIPGTIGLVICLACLFVNGFGVLLVVSPSTTYFVDVLNKQSAQVYAVTSAIRYSVYAVASAAVLRVMNALGVGITNGLTAVLAWLGYGLLLVTIRYGDKLRARVDIGYTTS